MVTSSSSDIAGFQINALNAMQATENADIDFLLAQLGINLDSVTARTAVRSFRKQIIIVAASQPATPTIDDVPSCGQENDYRRATQTVTGAIEEVAGLIKRIRSGSTDAEADLFELVARLSATHTACPYKGPFGCKCAPGECKYTPTEGDTEDLASRLEAHARNADYSSSSFICFEAAAALRSRAAAARASEPVAWRYELATSRVWRRGLPEAYADWQWRVSETKPEAGDAMRNVTPLYAGTLAQREQEPNTLGGMIAAIYGDLDAEDCRIVDRAWIEWRGRGTITSSLSSTPFYGAQCPSYPACSGGCGLGCTHEIEQARAEQNT